MRLWCFGSQKQLNEESFGPNLADVEKQIAAHNILHQAIQFYSTQLTPDSIASSVRARVVVSGGSMLDLIPELMSKKRTFFFCFLRSLKINVDLYLTCQSDTFNIRHLTFKKDLYHK